jgi:hypothetical protein
MRKWGKSMEKHVINDVKNDVKLSNSSSK